MLHLLTLHQHTSTFVFHRPDVYKRQTMEGIARKLLLLYTRPYIITKDKMNNTYELTDPTSQQIKGTYNQAAVKRCEDLTQE